MLKNTLLLFIMCCAIGTATAQDLKELKKTAKRDAEAVVAATLKEDFTKLMDYTHPKIIEVSGGKEVMISLLKSTFENMKKDGFSIEKIELLSVSDVVKEQGEYRCYAKNHNVFRMNDKRIISDSYIIGFYNEEVKSWYFLEAKELLKPSMVSAYFPDFKTEMKIPDNTMKVEDIKEE